MFALCRFPYVFKFLYDVEKPSFSHMVVTVPFCVEGRLTLGLCMAFSGAVAGKQQRGNLDRDFSLCLVSHDVVEPRASQRASLVLLVAEISCELPKMSYYILREHPDGCSLHCASLSRLP